MLKTWHRNYIETTPPDAGFSLHYLPLFLTDALHVAPSQVPLFCIASRVAAAFAALAAHRASAGIGRVPTMLLARAADWALLTAMGCIPAKGVGLAVLKCTVVMGHVGATAVDPLG